PGLTDVPIIRMQLQLDQFLVAILAQINLDWLDPKKADLVNASVAPVPNLDVAGMTRLLVVPVNEVDVAIVAVAHVDEPRPSIVGEQEIPAMRGDVSGSLGFGNVHVQPAAVDVPHEDL